MRVPMPPASITNFMFVRNPVEKYLVRTAL
jgi:hypothetical protein